ncbi:hybrid sensor histidine kinase/response regulator transcription factor [Mangrovibacterium lignilyticum]|uniref:hybrid sensor histidine kinase/response regulator transcription factor n=1 Tax=Mangrovibacterium lignilyticum TaxID=2668052 RepID=UPI0013D682E4|nr:two-component regulator propeller domain-containing protein [Mangrovibacterium lignilyticum]
MKKNGAKYHLFFLNTLVCLIALLCFHQTVFAQDQEPIQFRHYTPEDGLPSSYVKSITQDTDGFIWAATRTAVVRFDGQNFQEFPTYNDSLKPLQIFCNKLFMTKDSIPIARTNNESYYYFNRDLESFYPYPLLTALGPTSSIVASKGGFWVCQNDQIFFLNEATGQREGLRQKLKLFQIPEGSLFTSILERGNRLVFATTKGKIYSYQNNELREFDLPNELNKDQFDLRFIDSHDNLWIHSQDYGLANLNLTNNYYSFYAEARKDSYHLPHNLVHCFTEDHEGRVWVGTESGLAIYDPETDNLALHHYKLAEPNGLNTDPIYDAFCDQQGNIWLGTYFGGINFWNGEKQFFRTWTSGFGKWHLSGNVVSCLTEDVAGNLWIGLEDKGLNKLNRQNGKMTHYSSEDGPNSLSYNNLHDLLFVNDHELWIATYTGGINVLNTKTNRFEYYNRKNTNNALSDVIYQFEKVDDRVYIATSEGIVVFEQKDKKFHKLKPEITSSFQFESIAKNGQFLWFSSAQQVFRYDISKDSIAPFRLNDELQIVNFVKTDSKGRVWFGSCYNGLFYLDGTTGEITQINEDNGFPAQWIFSLEEGKNGWYWASTNKGLVKFQPETGASTLYDSNSGIPFNQFNYRASFTDSKGNTYFGGNNGMISFNEESKPSQIHKLPVVFTGFQLFNKHVHPGDIKCMDRSINELDELVLKYNQNVFTLEYTAFSYATGGRCQYSYFLDGFETKWNNVGNRNFATYTNLSPGTYTFRVKAIINDNLNEPQERQLTITILPPFWLTNWAFGIYGILAILIFILVFRVGKNLEKTKAMAELQRREKVHADEIHKVKLEFFTNISHELKTPLTLILGPLNKLMAEEKLSPAFRKRLIGIERNANRLFLLINQLLEFRKIENGKEKLKVSPCDVSLMMDDISNSFTNLSETRDIDFQLEFPAPGKMAWFDVNKVDKIIFNLLSNAFKFTPEGGKISFTVELKKRIPRTPDELIDMVITVSDSGKGIKQEMLNKVFDRFFQIEEEQVDNTGSGIGLAFVKSLVLLHKGQITVDSIVNKGTSFKVQLPVSKEDFNSQEISIEPVQYHQAMRAPVIQDVSGGKSETINPDALSSKPTILIVEDNIDLINFMKESLEMSYQVVMALNGVKALEKLEKVTPELIISDVMMPEMDGIELTNRLKSDLKLSHIPIILLTSKSGMESKLQGLRSGADYYIEKPFYPNILEQNIENILNTRRRLIERFKTDDTIQIEEVAHSESDKIFIEKLTVIIKENISNPDMDVSFLIKEMGVSRSLLHIKLKGLVGCSSTEFIRAIRLKEAVKLISSGKCNISEAAYETGFSSPTYFTRRFREFYGKSPRDYFNH